MTADGNKKPDLSVSVGGLRLKNPIISAAGPQTANISTVRKGVDAGCGAIVARSLHLMAVDERKRPIRNYWYITHSKKDFIKNNSLYSFQSGHVIAKFPKTRVDPGFGGSAIIPTLAEYTEIVTQMVQYAHDKECKLIGSIGTCGHKMPGFDVWKAEAEAMAKAGVDAIELHTSPSPPTEGARFVQHDPEQYLVKPIQLAKQTTGLPIWTKIGVDCCDTITAAKIAEQAGASAVVPVARWISLSVDVDNPANKIMRVPGIGGPWSEPIMAGLIYRMIAPPDWQRSDSPLAGGVKVSVVSSGGVRSDRDVLKQIMVGASAVEICTEILIRGYGIVPKMLRGIEKWMVKHGFNNIEDFRATVKLRAENEGHLMPEWIPSVDESACKGCGGCVNGCWNEAIQIQQDVAVIDLELCQGCGNCSYVCPEDAIKINEVFA